jgi:hypothetical protein
MRVRRRFAPQRRAQPERSDHAQHESDDALRHRRELLLDPGHARAQRQRDSRREQRAARVTEAPAEADPPRPALRSGDERRDAGEVVGPGQRVVHAREQTRGGDGGDLERHGRAFWGALAPGASVSEHSPPWNASSRAGS